MIGTAQDMSAISWCTFSHMSPPSSPTDTSSVVKVTSTARKLHSSHIPLIRKPQDLLSLPVCTFDLTFFLSPVQDKYNYAVIASAASKEEFCRPKRRLEKDQSSNQSISRRLSSYSLASVERIVDKRQKFERGSDYISPNSLSAASMAERKLDLTDDDVAFLVSYNQLLRKSSGNDASVLFTDEDFIKAFYKWDVESIKSSIGKGVVKTQRIDSVNAFSFLKPAGVKKDIPIELFSPLYDYYCRRWDAHQNLPVCRCSWVIIQQLNEYKSLLSSAKLA